MPQESAESKLRRRNRALRNAIVSHYIKPLISMGSKEEWSQTLGVDIKAVENLCKNRIINDSDLQKIVDYAAENWYLADSIHQMLSELKLLEPSMAPGEQDQPAGEEDKIHRLQRDAVDEAWENLSGHDVPPIDEGLAQTLKAAYVVFSDDDELLSDDGIQQELQDIKANPTTGNQTVEMPVKLHLTAATDLQTVELIIDRYIGNISLDLSGVADSKIPQIVQLLEQAIRLGTNGFVNFQLKLANDNQTSKSHTGY